RIGAVFQEAPHEISEQVAVAADGGVDADGGRWMIRAYKIVKHFAHAMQALELVASNSAGFLDYARHRQRIVSGELRINARAGCEQLARADGIAEIGHRLAGEYGIIRQPALLRALDLGVPIGALDQAQHDAAATRR